MTCATWPAVPAGGSTVSEPCMSLPMKAAAAPPGCLEVDQAVGAEVAACDGHASVGIGPHRGDYRGRPLHQVDGLRQDVNIVAVIQHQVPRARARERRHAKIQSQGAPPGPCRRCSDTQVGAARHAEAAQIVRRLRNRRIARIRLHLHEQARQCAIDDCGRHLNRPRDRRRIIQGQQRARVQVARGDQVVGRNRGRVCTVKFDPLVVHAAAVTRE